MTRPQPSLKNVRFFMKHAGYAQAPGETKAQARRRCAVGLAKAESEMKDRGWYVDWEHDPEPYQTDIEGDEPSEVLVAFLRDAEGRVLASLGGIGDPSRDYGRVIEAELADEALASFGESREPLP